MHVPLKIHLEISIVWDFKRQVDRQLTPLNELG
jgi:hypothetical protein